MPDHSPRQQPRPLRAKLRDLGLLSRTHEAALPQFLILGSEHSGARQLAQLVRHYPGCSLPASLGTRYFSSRHQWCDLEWYLRALGDDVHQIRGEWTPSYSLLPVKTIRLLQELIPALKLVFLLTDPAVEVRYASQHQRVVDAEITAESWAPADSLGQLRRWQSSFSTAQIFIGFGQDLRTDPRSFLENLNRFLGNERSPVAWSGFDEPPDAGNLSTDISPLELALYRAAWRLRTDALADYLRCTFSLNVPAGWSASSAAAVDERQVAQLAHVVSTVAAREFDDVFLHRAVAHAEFDTPAAQWLESRSGFDLYLVNQRVAAVPAGQLISGDSDLNEHAVWADDLPALRAALGSAQVAADGPGQEGHSLRLDPHLLPIYGDVPMRLAIQGYRGFKIVNLRGQFGALAPNAEVADPANVSEQTMADLIQVERLLAAPTIPLVIAAVDAFLERQNYQ